MESQQETLSTSACWYRDDVAQYIDEAHAIVASSNIIRKPRILNLSGNSFLAIDTGHVGARSFKIRGATVKMTSLAQRGVLDAVTCTTGSHGIACAVAARELGMSLTVFVPAKTPRFKVEALRELNVDLRESIHEGWDQAADEATLWGGQNGLAMVHPFDDPLLCAGQGTLLSDVVDQIGIPSAVFTPVGGGGLAAGIVSVSRHRFGGSSDIIGVEPARRASLWRALNAGHPVSVDYDQTLAQGANVGRVGERTFNVMRSGLTHATIVSEEHIADAMRSLASLGVVAEGAGALAYAAWQHRNIDWADGPIVLIVSGGTITAEDQARPMIPGSVRR